MWRRLHTLTPLQALIAASFSAAVIALPLAVYSLLHDQTAILRNLLWPDVVDPYITFSLAFLGILPVLLGYYHLGRLGFLLNAAFGFVLAWLMAVCCLLCFVALGHYLGSVWLSGITYLLCAVLAYLTMVSLHFRLAYSATVRDAQKKLRLGPIR